MRSERPRVVQSQRHGHPRLEPSKNPDLDPATLGVQVPRKNYARLKHVEDICATCHGTVDVLACLLSMIVCKYITTVAVNQDDLAG